MHIDDTAQLAFMIIPDDAEKYHCRDPVVGLDIYVHCGKVDRYPLEYIRIRDMRIVEPGSINKRDDSPGERKGVGRLDLRRTRLQTSSCCKIRAAEEVYELDGVQ